MSLRYPKLLRQLRTEAHKSQAELAEVLGTSQTMYARYERGANALPLRHLLTLCEYYDVSADYLLGRTPTGKIQICYNMAYRKAPHFAMRCLFVCNTEKPAPFNTRVPVCFVHAIYYALGRIASRSGPLDTMVILWPISCSMKAT